MSLIDDTAFLPLINLGDPEGPPNWSAFEENPTELFQYLVNHFGIDPLKLSSIQRFFIGTEQPELDSIWGYTGEIPFIGLPIDGEFVKFYRFPPNSPFILISDEHLGSGVVRLEQAEIDAYGLVELNAPAFWAMLEIVT